MNLVQWQLVLFKIMKYMIILKTLNLTLHVDLFFWVYMIKVVI